MTQLLAIILYLMPFVAIYFTVKYYRKYKAAKRLDQQRAENDHDPLDMDIIL